MREWQREPQPPRARACTHASHHRTATTTLATPHSQRVHRAPHTHNTRDPTGKLTQHRGPHGEGDSPQCAAAGPHPAHTQPRVGIVLTGRRAAREGSELRDQDNRVVGAVTSGSFSPTLDKPIAMAYVPSEVSQPGTVLDVDIRGTRVSATVTVLPFYKRP